jgi:hypothetical protein
MLSSITIDFEDQFKGKLVATPSIYGGYIDVLDQDGYYVTTLESDEIDSFLDQK